MSGRVVLLPPGSYDHFAPLYDDGRFDRFSLFLASRVEGRLERCGARRVLELACGTGSLLARIAAAGRTVIGVDRSFGMLAEAHRKEGPFFLAAGDFRALPFRADFDVALCFYDSLNYLLGEEELRRAFCEVRRLLRPGGEFLFDMNNLAAYEQVWNAPEPYRAKCRAGMVTIRSRFDVERSMGEAEVDIETEEGEEKVTYRSVHRQRFHSPPLVESLLRDAGFDHIAMEEIDPFPDEEDFDLTAKTLWTARARKGMTAP